jgi:hypothetical protein
MYVNVYDLARGCMYIDEKWHGCSRRSSCVVGVWVGNRLQYHTRCDEHKKAKSYGAKHPPVGSYAIVTDAFMGLGYKP